MINKQAQILMILEKLNYNQIKRSLVWGRTSGFSEAVEAEFNEIQLLTEQPECVGEVQLWGGRFECVYILLFVTTLHAPSGILCFLHRKRKKKSFFYK